MSRDSVTLVPTAEIYYDESFNCRGEIMLSSCVELADSIKGSGLIVPILVQPRCDVPDLPPGYKYRLVAGHRRFVSVTRLLKETSILAIVRYGLDETDALAANLIENLDRKELNILEEAFAVARLVRKTSFRKTSWKLKRSLPWVQMRCFIDSLPADIKQELLAGNLDISDIKCLKAEYNNSPEELALAAEILMARNIKLAKSRKERQALRKRKYKPLRTRRELQQMAMWLALHDIHVDGVRALSWAAKDITDEELLEGSQDASVKVQDS